MMDANDRNHTSPTHTSPARGLPDGFNLRAAGPLTAERLALSASDGDAAGAGTLGGPCIQVFP